MLRDVVPFAFEPLRQESLSDWPWDDSGSFGPSIVLLYHRRDTLGFRCGVVVLLGAVFRDVVKLPWAVPLGDQLPIADADASVALVLDGDRFLSRPLLAFQYRYDRLAF